MSEDKCVVCDKVLDYELQYCCNEYDCSCGGRPVHPPVCSNECCDEFMKTNKEYKQ